MQTYQQRTQRQLRLSDSAWGEELRTFLLDIKDRIDQVRDTYEIPADPPAIIRSDNGVERFAPHGWVGHYPGDVIVTPDKLTTTEFERLKNEVAGWLEFWGVPTAAVVMPLFQERTRDKQALLMGYSRKLQEYTEQALAGRPPVRVSRSLETGPAPNGPLRVEETISKRATGAQEVVYDTVTFSFDSPVNKLLVRFHLELASQFAELADRSLIMTERFRRRHRYHEEVIQSRLPVDLVEESLDADFGDPHLLERIEQNLPREVAGLVELWEAYQQQQAMAVSFREQLDAGIKPISKLYELWLLQIMLLGLSQITGTRPEVADSNFNEFSFGSSVRLYYDTPLKEHSRFLNPEMDVHPGRPDFVIEAEATPVFVADAKYKYQRTIGLDDGRQLLSYMVDLLPADGSRTAAICYISDDQQPTETHTDAYSVVNVPLRPRHKDNQAEHLTRIIHRCLPDSVKSEPDGM